MSRIHIKVSRIPGATQEIELSEGTTLQSFLISQGSGLRENEAVSVNGLDANLHQILKEGDRVSLSIGARGEFTVKRDGIWRLHMNDLDPWPSKPHAHNQDNAVEVLNLYTGVIYNNDTRMRIRKLSRGDLAHVKEQFGLRKDESTA